MQRPNRGAANRGMPFEKALEVQHAVYLAQGLAKLWKIQNPLKQVGWVFDKQGKRTNIIKACHTRGENADFMGVIKGGRSIQLEAKSRKSSSVSLDSIQPHQAECLRINDRFGGFSGVLVCINTGIWLLPWLEWTTTGKKSLNRDDLSLKGVQLADASRAQIVLSATGSCEIDWLRAAARRRWI